MAQRVDRGIALLFHDHGTGSGEWSATRPGRTLAPGKTRYPLYRGLGGAGLEGRKISPHRDYTGLFISPSGISELDCATTKTVTAERSISIVRESLQVFFVLGALAYFQGPLLGGSRDENGVHSE